MTISPSDDPRCRYLVSDDTRCPNERAPGGPLCRPHLAQAAALAERLGLGGQEP